MSTGNPSFQLTPPRVFRGTRVPVSNLFDYIVNGSSLKAFLEDFPTVSFEQVRQVLQAAEVHMEECAA